MSHEPLTTEKANPCMKCGSVQCSFCSDDVASAVELTIQEIYQEWETPNGRYARGFNKGLKKAMKKIKKNFSGVLAEEEEGQ